MAIQITRELPEIVTNRITVNAGGNSIYGNFIIELPNDLIGKTITAVKLNATWSATQPEVSGVAPDMEHYLSFRSALDQHYRVSSEDILTKFQSGNTSVKIYTIIKNTGNRNRQFWWNVKISITYESNELEGFFTGMMPDDLGKYTLSAYSIAENEVITVKALLNDNDSQITSISLGIKNNSSIYIQKVSNLVIDEDGIYSGTFSFNRDDQIGTPPSTQNNIYNQMNSNSSAWIHFTYKFSDESTQGIGALIKDINNKSFKFCKERIGPTINFSNLFGNTNYFPIINTSQNNDINFDIGLSSIDSNIRLASIGYTYNNNQYSLNETSSTFTITLPSIPPQGTTYSLIVEATDSFGATSSAEISVVTCQYTAPSFNLEIQRMIHDVSENTYQHDDDGTILGVSGTITWQPTIEILENQSLSNTLQLFVSKITTNDSRFTDGNIDFNIIDLSSALSIITYSDDVSILTYTYKDTLNNVTVVTNDFNGSFNYQIELKLQDNFNSYTQEFFINKSTPGYLNIEKTGVAVGIRSTGSAQNKKFECNYPAYFYQDIYQNSSPLINQITLNNQLNNFFSIQNYIVDGNTVYYLKLGNFLMAFGQANASSNSNDGHFSSIFKKNNSSIFSSIPCMYGTWISTTSTYNSGALGSLQFYNISQDGFYVIAGGSVPPQNDAKPINWIAIGSAASNV